MSADPAFDKFDASPLEDETLECAIEDFAFELVS